MLLNSFEMDENIGEDICGFRSKNLGRTKQTVEVGKETLPFWIRGRKGGRGEEDYHLVGANDGKKCRMGFGLEIMNSIYLIWNFFICI